MLRRKIRREIHASKQEIWVSSRFVPTKTRTIRTQPYVYSFAPNLYSSFVIWNANTVHRYIEHLQSAFQSAFCSVL